MDQWQSTLENLVIMSFHGFYQGKRVLVTGHTGFKGSWLCEWLLALGAKVFGYALAPPTDPALFNQLGLSKRLEHQVGDVREAADVARAVSEVQPDIVFHLAAQSLVRRSYLIPLETYDVNVMGTANVLDALRYLRRPCAAVMITTDKCYENQEWVHGYREGDPMGGYDPYSSSKAAAELVIAAYRRSYFSSSGAAVQIASARAGNVIGGGDWALDRIVPDCMRHLALGEVVPVRNRTATRPWQHVLEPLSGYLWLGARLAQRDHLTPRLTGGFNFGPELASNQSVATLVDEIIRHWPGSWKDCSDPHALHEAGKLNLATDKAYHLLGWKPVWNFATTVEVTAQWYRETNLRPTYVGELTSQHISRYVADATTRNYAWASTSS